MNNCFDNLVTLLESELEENIKLVDNLMQNEEYHFEYKCRYGEDYQCLSVAYDFMKRTGRVNSWFNKEYFVRDLITLSTMDFNHFATITFDTYFLLVNKEDRASDRHFLFDTYRSRQPKSWRILRNMVEKQLEPTDENMKDLDKIINKESIKKNWDYIKTRKIV